MPGSGEFLRVVDAATESDSRPEHVPNSIQHIETLNAEEGRYDLTVDGFGMIAVWKGDRSLTISAGSVSQTIEPGKHAAGMPGLTYEAIVDSINLHKKARVDTGKLAVSQVEHEPIAA